MPGMIKVHFELFAAVDRVKQARVEYFLSNRQYMVMSRRR